MKFIKLLKVFGATFISYFHNNTVIHTVEKSSSNPMPLTKNSSLLQIVKDILDLHNVSSLLQIVKDILDLHNVKYRYYTSDLNINQIVFLGAVEYPLYLFPGSVSNYQHWILIYKTKAHYFGITSVISSNMLMINKIQGTASQQTISALKNFIIHLNTDCKKLRDDTGTVWKIVEKQQLLHVYLECYHDSDPALSSEVRSTQIWRAFGVWNRTFLKEVDGIYSLFGCSEQDEAMSAVKKMFKEKGFKGLTERKIACGMRYTVAICCDNLDEDNPMKTFLLEIDVTNIAIFRLSLVSESKVIAVVDSDMAFEKAALLVARLNTDPLFYWKYAITARQIQIIATLNYKIIAPNAILKLLYGMYEELVLYYVKFINCKLEVERKMAPFMFTKQLCQKQRNLHVFTDKETKNLVDSQYWQACLYLQQLMTGSYQLLELPLKCKLQQKFVEMAHEICQEEYQRFMACITGKNLYVCEDLKELYPRQSLQYSGWRISSIGCGKAKKMIFVILPQCSVNADASIHYYIPEELRRSEGCDISQCSTDVYEVLSDLICIMRIANVSFASDVTDIKVLWYEADTTIASDSFDPQASKQRNLPCLAIYPFITSLQHFNKTPSQFSQFYEEFKQYYSTAKQHYYADLLHIIQNITEEHRALKYDCGVNDNYIRFFINHSDLQQLQNPYNTPLLALEDTVYIGLLLSNRMLLLHESSVEGPLVFASGEEGALMEQRPMIDLALETMRSYQACNENLYGSLCAAYTMVPTDEDNENVMILFHTTLSKIKPFSFSVSQQTQTSCLRSIIVIGMIDCLKKYHQVEKSIILDPGVLFWGQPVRDDNIQVLSSILYIPQHHNMLSFPMEMLQIYIGLTTEELNLAYLTRVYQKKYNLNELYQTSQMQSFFMLASIMKDQQYHDHTIVAILQYCLQNSVTILNASNYREHLDKHLQLLSEDFLSQTQREKLCNIQQIMEAVIPMSSQIKESELIDMLNGDHGVIQS